MSEFSFIKAIVIFITTCIACFFGASTGGSGMLTIPVCVSLGFPAHVAIATTRVGAFFSMIGAFAGFLKNKKIDYKLSLIGACISCIGACCGSYSMAILEDVIAKKIVGVIMIVLMLVSFVKKRTNLTNESITMTKKLCGYFAFFIIGGIGGAFGGQGAMLVYVLTIFFGKELVVAAGTRILISFFITVVSLLVYSTTGSIDVRYGIVISIASLIGTYFGALFSIKGGDGMIDKVLDVIVVIMVVKILCF